MAKSEIEISYFRLFRWGIFWMSRGVCRSDRIGLNTAKDFVFPWNGTTYLIWVERI